MRIIANKWRTCCDCVYGGSITHGVCIDCFWDSERPSWKSNKKGKYDDENARIAVFNLINTERNRQEIKWGEQNHPPEKWTGILGEEFGEYCQAVNETVFNNGADQKLKGGFDNMLKELTHVAAVAVGAMESLMRNKAENK